MAFGGSGFSGFGQNNNQQSSGFGFGSTSNTGSGFGSTSNSNAFGATNNNTASTTGGGLFGSSGGFGGTGAFGSSNNAFGAKAAFGTPTTSAGGGLFGASTTTAGGGSSGGGGFGSFGNQANATTTSPFGGGSASLFGGNKSSAFGTPAATGSSNNNLFGGGSGGFGNTAATATGSFGSANNPTNLGESPGTGGVPFAATNEKEATNPSQSNSFQNVLFMDNYKKWSAEELRLADYNQGRRTGGTGGAFGATSTFGGTAFGGAPQSTSAFGSTAGAGGLFGSTNQPSSTGFGANTSTSGFGGAGAGGLFAQKQPATGGLFGAGASQPAAQTGGLFGASSPFGSGGTANTAGNAFGGGSSGSLFGSTTAQNKPAALSFGNPGTSAFGQPNTGSAFGTTSSASNATGGLFGGTAQPAAGASGGLFGSTQQATNTFGGPNAVAQPQNQGSLFGGQAKPLFGTGSTTTAGGGLFGASNPASTPFGVANNTLTTGGSLFGQSKPAVNNGGLFGSTGLGQNTSTGLFGGANTMNQSQPTAGAGLFGASQTQPQKPSLFGTTAQPSTAGGLFGQANSQQGSIFGASNAQQQPQGSLFGGSLLGGAGSANAAQPLSTSINDLSAYGSTSLFSNLPNGEIANPGPLATPLSGKAKTKTRSILPMYKLSPANSSRFLTPKRGGYGFSYSTYGSPATPSSVASTPGTFGQSLLTGSIGRGLSKSISTSNLRRSFNVEDSILQPGAFSASSSSRFYGSGGSHRKLIINRDMRSDLFSSPSKDKQALDLVNGSRKLSKKVSFDTSNVENGADNDERSTPEHASSTPQDFGLLRPSSGSINGVNGGKAAATPVTPEMEQAKGKELAIVHEEEGHAPAPQTVGSLGDKEAGAYWMRPTKEEIFNMNRMQRQKVYDFEVGRDNVGSIRFKVPVDLSNIDLDNLWGNIIDLQTRTATVYPVSAQKPPVGKGLNVPAQISLEHSWPRGRDKRTPLQEKSGSRLQKHIERLKRIESTTFEDYDPDTGVWTFSVEHFTTYGLEYEEDDTGADGMTEAASATEPTIHHAHHPAVQEPSPASLTDPEDTFDFKRTKSEPSRKRKALPGAFDANEFSDDDNVFDGPEEQLSLSQQTNDSAPPPEPAGFEQDDMSGIEQDGNDDIQELYENEEDMGLQQSSMDTQQVSGGIMRARLRALKESHNPKSVLVTGGDDWITMLHQTVRGGRRMDRAKLKDLNTSGAAFDIDDTLGDRVHAPADQIVPDGLGFATSIDLMNSLFGKATGPLREAEAQPTRSFLKWPFPGDNDSSAARQQLVRLESQSTDDAERRGLATDSASVLAETPLEAAANVASIEKHIQKSKIQLRDGIPYVAVEHLANLKSPFHHPEVQSRPSTTEAFIWETVEILFSTQESIGGSRRGQLVKFWDALVSESTTADLRHDLPDEEKALICLAGHRVGECCKYLIQSKNFKLATLVSTAGSGQRFKRDMQQQVHNWRDTTAISEISAPIRAIYEILGGNVCTSEGIKGVSPESRAPTFVISERFGLDWRRSFGLRLWYGVVDDDLTGAIKMFKDDVAQGREATPKPSLATMSGEGEDTGEDILWGLLKAFLDGKADMESLLQPKNFGASGSAIRLSWQLGRALLGTGRVSFGAGTVAKADESTRRCAAQLVQERAWPAAIFVLLHLANPAAREAAVRELLAKNGGDVGQETDKNFGFLAKTLHIPAPWIWQAKAAYCRSVQQDSVVEIEFLMRAGNFNEANSVVAEKLGPRAVVEERPRDKQWLQRMLQRLQEHEQDVADWRLGGSVYRDYLDFAAGFETGIWRTDALEGLIETLPALATKSSASVLMSAAVMTMSDRVATGLWRMSNAKDEQFLTSATGRPMSREQFLERHNMVDLQRVLRLPLTSERRVHYTRQLGHVRLIQGAA